MGSRVCLDQKSISTGLANGFLWRFSTAPTLNQPFIHSKPQAMCPSPSAAERRTKTTARRVEGGRSSLRPGGAWSGGEIGAEGPRGGERRENPRSSKKSPANTIQLPRKMVRRVMERKRNRKRKR